MSMIWYAYVYDMIQDMYKFMNQDKTMKYTEHDLRISPMVWFRIMSWMIYV